MMSLDFFSRKNLLRKTIISHERGKKSDSNNLSSGNVFEKKNFFFSKNILKKYFGDFFSSFTGRSDCYCQPLPIS